MAETVNVSSGLWPDSRWSNWVNDEETVAVLGYGRRAGEGRVREGLTDSAAREVLRELDRYDHTFPAAHHLQYLALEQDAVATWERLAPEVYVYALLALDINAQEVVCVGPHRE